MSKKFDLVNYFTFQYTLDDLEQFNIKEIDTPSLKQVMLGVSIDYQLSPDHDKANTKSRLHDLGNKIANELESRYGVRA